MWHTAARPISNRELLNGIEAPPSSGINSPSDGPLGDKVPAGGKLGDELCVGGQEIVGSQFFWKHPGRLFECARGDFRLCDFDRIKQDFQVFRQNSVFMHRASDRQALLQAHVEFFL
jgi:hypothetical protein